MIAPSPPPPIGFQYLQLEPSCPQLIVFNYSEKKNGIFGLGKWRYISLVDALVIVGDGVTIFDDCIWFLGSNGLSSRAEKWARLLEDRLFHNPR